MLAVLHEAIHKSQAASHAIEAACGWNMKYLELCVDVHPLLWALPVEL